MTQAIHMKKTVIPLLMEIELNFSLDIKHSFSEYLLYIRFFQKTDEKTDDEKYWPKEKFDELVMQLKRNLTHKEMTKSTIKNQYANVFISYHSDKKNQIDKLYKKLTRMGLTCWLDLYQMDTSNEFLFEKIENAISNCKIFICCITFKYCLEFSCRRELSFAESTSKPIIFILLESNVDYPSCSISLDKIDFSENSEEQETWDGDNFNQLLEKFKEILPNNSTSLFQ